MVLREGTQAKQVIALAKIIFGFYKVVVAHRACASCGKMWSMRGIAHELIVQIGNCGQDCAILEVSLIAVNSLTLRERSFWRRPTNLSINK